MTGAWASWMGAMAWQAGLLVLALAAADLLLRRTLWPQALHAMWLLVPLKLLLPPTLESPFREAAAAGMRREAAGSWLFWPWAAGVAAVAVVHVARARALRRAAARGARPLPPALEGAAARVARSVGLRRTPRVVLSDLAGGPAVFGLLRPTVLLPRAIAARDVEPALLHEFTHVRRGDLLLQALFSALHALYWFHPLLVYARRRAHALREACCDADVARRVPAQAAAYAHALRRAARRLLLPGAAAFSGGEVAERLSWLGRRRPRHPRVAAALLALTLAAALPMAAPGNVVPHAERAALQALREVGQPGAGCMRARLAVLYLTREGNP